MYSSSSCCTDRLTLLWSRWLPALSLPLALALALALLIARITPSLHAQRSTCSYALRQRTNLEPGREGGAQFECPLWRTKDWSTGPLVHWSPGRSEIYEREKVDFDCWFD